MTNKKVVLAFSGGLDTSYCVKYLKLEKKLGVFAAIVNTGGFDQEELGKIKTRAFTQELRTLPYWKKRKTFIQNV